MMNTKAKNQSLIDDSIRVQPLPHAGDLKGVMIHYFLRGMLATKLPWKKTAWTCAGFPVELLWAYDVFPHHPENMATVAAARKQSLRLIEYTESLGYSRDLCSYCKTSIGAYDTGIKATLGGLDKPDFITCTNTICDTHWKWFHLQAHRLKVPIFVFDVPSVVSGTSPETMEGYVDYVVEQFILFGEFMQKNFGKKPNEKKLRKVMKLSERLSSLWREIYEYRKIIPSVYSAAETSASFFPLVVLPGVKKGIQFYEKLLSDIKKRAAKGEGTLQEGKEKYRVLYEGIPFWYRMRFMYDLAKYGIVVTYEPYTWSFAPKKTMGLSLEESLRETARTIMNLPYAYNLEDRIEYFEKAVQEYRIDGVILHENMSCRPSSSGMIDLKEAIQRDLGVPVLILQCDMNDPRAFSEAQIQTRVESFVELMADNKK
jgi:benzoyl-CoA reductase/2-hydroxyglutaryl-CoA dehydratase subunit BcrC/BadD/HgdB